MNLGLHGKVAIVTASSKGLGKASAMSLAMNGAKVCMSARSDLIDAAAAEVRAACGRPEDIITMRADVSQKNDIEVLVAATLQKWGRIDILVANAGGPKPGTFLDTSADDWPAAVDLTLMSLVRLCYAVSPVMREQKSGVILSIQSFSVKQGVPNLLLSNSIRMACIGFLKSISNELGPFGIRVNSVNPGLHATDRLKGNLGGTEEAMQRAASTVPMRCINTPEKFGDCVAFFCSEPSSYITGQAIVIDGGAVTSAL